jgi:hypothetical protein
MKTSVAFKIGDQVRLSELGRLTFQNVLIAAKVVRVGDTPASYRVWNGDQLPSTYWMYLELDDARRAR